MAPSNEPPEIPNLKPPTGKEEEKKGAGSPLSRLGRGGPSQAAGESGVVREPDNPLTNLGTPRAGGSPVEKPATGSGFRFPGFGGKGSSMPNLRVRGLPGGSTLVDRLKNLRKKDLIFIMAGLCTLGTAPLAEHLLMAPDEQAGQLKEGFDSKGPLFQDGSSVYESGSGVGSPGGLVGQGSDVITPLNVRDPSNLVMSPGAKKQADAVVTPPPPPSASAGKAEPDWKDVLRDTAKAGATKGIQAATKLPMPNVKLAGAIRGLSALGGGGGGTGASLKLDPLSAQHAPNHAAESNALSRSQATPGYRGAATRSNSSSGSDEALRAAGMKQADIFNKGGSAANALDTASREAIPTGGGPGQFGGRPGDGDVSKNPGGNSNKDNKQMGESLAYLRAKMEMEKAIDLKWKQKEWNQFGRSKMIQESAIKMGFDMFGKFAQAAFVDPLANAIGQAVQPQSAALYNCVLNQGGARVGGTKAAIQAQGYTVIGTTLWSSSGDNKQPVGTCTVVSGGDPGSQTNPNQDASAPGRIAGPPRPDPLGPAQNNMQQAWDRYCKDGAPESLGATSQTCTMMRTLKSNVDNTMATIRDNNDNALRFIHQAYGTANAGQAANGMRGEVTALGKAVSSLGAATGDAAAGAGNNAKPPFTTIKEKFDAATSDLSSGNNTKAKTDLTDAKTQGYQPLVGPNGALANLQQGAALADAKNQQGEAETNKSAAEGALNNARTQVTTGLGSVSTLRQQLTGMQAPSEPAGVPVLARVRTQVGATLDQLEAQLNQTGGTAQTEGGFIKAARDVYTSQVDKLRSDVYGANVGDQAGGARGSVFSAAQKAEDALGVLAQGTWKDASDPAVIAAAQAAQPAQTPEKYAATQNQTALGTKLTEFGPLATAAKGKVTPLVPQPQQVMTQLTAAERQVPGVPEPTAATPPGGPAGR